MILHNWLKEFCSRFDLFLHSGGGLGFEKAWWRRFVGVFFLEVHVFDLLFCIVPYLDKYGKVKSSMVDLGFLYSSMVCLKTSINTIFECGTIKAKKRRLKALSSLTCHSFINSAFSGSD